MKIDDFLYHTISIEDIYYGKYLRINCKAEKTFFIFLVFTLLFWL